MKGVVRIASGFDFKVVHSAVNQQNYFDVNNKTNVEFKLMFVYFVKIYITSSKTKHFRH